MLIVLALLLLGGGGFAVYNMTRGLRNNNPGNILDDGTAWEGLDTPRNDGAYLRFVSPAYGLRAMGKTLENYVLLDDIPPTVADIITRYAPPASNPTANYIAFVSGVMGVDPQQPLSITPSGDLPALMAAMIRDEEGINPYSTADIISALQLA